jgi:signal peptidase I
MFRPPGRDHAVFKRVVACPGDSISMRDNHIVINEEPLRYRLQDRANLPAFADSGSLGFVVEREDGGGPSHVISFTPGASKYASFEPFTVPEDHYFLL